MPSRGEGTILYEGVRDAWNRDEPRGVRGFNLSAPSRFQASMELHNSLPLYLTYLGLRPRETTPAAQHGI
jgi:hypothetical protein